MDCIADFVRCFPQIAKYFKFTRTASQICEMFFLKSQNISNSQGLHRRFVRCFSSNRKIFQIHMDCIADLWDVFLKSQNISNSQGRHCFFDMCDCTHVHVLWCCLQVIMTALWISSRWLSLSSNNPSQLPRTPAWWADRYSFSSTIKLVWGLFYKHWRSQFDCKPDWQHQGAGRRREHSTGAAGGYIQQRLGLTVLTWSWWCWAVHEQIMMTFTINNHSQFYVFLFEVSCFWFPAAASR